MKRALLFIVFATLALSAAAQCKHTLPLRGAEGVRNCDDSKQRCLDPMKQVQKYMEKIAGNADPSIVNVALNASPWHFYDGEARILTPQELADRIRPAVAQGSKSVRLAASWSGVAPNEHTQSLAKQVATLLPDAQVTGADGFLWINKDGKLRTTRHSSTVMQGRFYEVAEGDEIFISLASGWFANFTEDFAAKKDVRLLRRAAAAWEIYMLCPERALRVFEFAAQLGEPVSAYNAALMRLERHETGDVEAATALLTKAADAGDAKSRARLDALRGQSR